MHLLAFLLITGSWVRVLVRRPPDEIYSNASQASCGDPSNVEERMATSNIFLSCIPSRDFRHGRVIARYPLSHDCGRLFRRGPRVAGCITPTGFAGHAGANGSSRLTSDLDHSVWPAQGWRGVRL